MSIMLRWGVPALLTVVGGTSLAISTTSAQMSGDLTSRATSVLASVGANWATVSFDARDALVTGTAGDQAAVDQAVAQVAAVRGVRSVRSEAILAELISPFPFRAEIRDGSVSLSGGVPSETAHAEILNAAGPAIDSLRLLSGAPEERIWRAAVDYGLAHLEHFDDGEFDLADLEVSVRGRAKSVAGFEALERLGSAPPDGVTVAAREVLPAVVAPFTLSATFDGTRVAVSGHTPSNDFAESLLAEGVGGRPVSPSLVLASGAPQDFVSSARLLLETLVLLEEGSATISGDTLALEGAPADPATAEAVTLAMNRIGATVSLVPPRAARYEFTASRAGGIVTLSGHVPDAPTRDRLDAMPGVDASALELARGAPERFASGVEFGLELLDHLSEGRFALENTRISIEGRAATAADYTKLETRIALGAPQGLILANADVRPPLAAPFVWSADKHEQGGITFEGFVPARQTRDTLHAAVANLAGDTTTVADGQPDNFEAEALAALEILPELTSGRVAYDGVQWSFTGSVESHEQRVAVEQAFAAAGLDAAGWTLELAAPPAAEPETDTAALPVTDPYLWRATKGADGRVTLDGFVHSDEVKRFLALRAGDVADDLTEVSPGEPTGFLANALAGLEALRHLSEGTAEYASGTWALSGTPKTADDAALAVAAVRDPSTGGVTWATEIGEPAVQPGEAGTLVADLPDEPGGGKAGPEVPAHVFSAFKPLDGTVALQGAVPSEQARGMLAQTVGAPQAVEPLTLDSGLPAGFALEANSGVRLLAGLDAGELAFDGQTWRLSGKVESESERTSFVARLAALPYTADWQTDIALLPPIDICRRKVDAFAGRNAILFQSGSTRLADTSLPAIDELAGYLESCTETTVFVEGHTDTDGADDLNLALSVARAEAVVEALIERGVSYQRLYAVGYGESLPIADNDTPAGKRANRRIAFSITDPAE